MESESQREKKGEERRERETEREREEQVARERKRVPKSYTNKERQRWRETNDCEKKERVFQKTNT